MASVLTCFLEFCAPFAEQEGTGKYLTEFSVFYGPDNFADHSINIFSKICAFDSCKTITTDKSFTIRVNALINSDLTRIAMRTAKFNIHHSYPYIQETIH